MFTLYSRSSRESVISDFVTLYLFLTEILVVNMTGPKQLHQPRIMNFQYRSKKNPVKRCFRPVWFDTFKWLHCMETSDSVTCHYCTSAIEQRKITFSKCQEDAFIKDPGYSNWKEASTRFAKHEKSNFHKEAVLKLMPSMRPIDELMYNAIVKSKQENKAMLMKLLQNIKFLARQGLPLRGDQGQGNFDQLILLHAEDDPSLLEWIRKKADKFTLPEIQNEILKIMALKLLRTIAAGIHESPYFTVMIDETTDITNKEQCTQCVHKMG